jgi:nitrite reductase/ring-hydroxylating ferredoxin subunit
VADDDEKQGLTRRSFIKVAGLVVVGTTLPACGGPGGPDMMNGNPICTAASVAAPVRPEDVAVGMAVRVDLSAERVFICRDANGIYAIDAKCTHLGSDVDFVSAQAGFKCPLHMATYDFNGEKPTLPATMALTHYAVCVTESGTLLVDVAQPVAASTRLKV